MWNLPPWQGRLIVPRLTSATVHPWWVQTALKARNPPRRGWVTTHLPLTVFPPPTGMLVVLASAAPAASADSAARAPAAWAGRAHPATETARAAAPPSRLRKIITRRVGDGAAGLLGAAQRTT